MTDAPLATAFAHAVVRLATAFAHAVVRLATAFAHAVVRLATTPAYRGDLTSAAAELAKMPGWQRRPEERRAGLRDARRLVAAHCGVKAAEAAINAA